MLVNGVTVGTAGGVASIVIGTCVAGLVPAALLAVTLAVAVPLASDCKGVTLQVPSTATWVVKTSPVPGIVTVMVSRAVPVPEMVGVVSRVMLSLLLTPVSLWTAISATGANGKT